MAHFLRIIRARHRRKVTGFTRRAMDALLKYDYPGNIRELQNLIERGVVYADNGGRIDLVHLFSGSEPLPPVTVSLSKEGKLGFAPFAAATATVSSVENGKATDFATLERETYALALQRAAGNISAAARQLGMTRAQLDYRMKRLGIPTKSTFINAQSKRRSHTVLVTGRVQE